MQQYPRKPIQDKDAFPVVLSEKDALPLLQSGEIKGGHRIPWGSNYTFLVRLDAGPGRYLRAIYKPRDGERPLHDFPQGTLYKREYLSYMLSRTLGWPDIPLTLTREGPYGIGSMQLYIEYNPEVTYFDLIDKSPRELQRFAVFDLLVNNADRKAGHCLQDNDGRIWSIDHGLTFHSMIKLRTVMLEFWDQPIPKVLLDDIETLLIGLESPNILAGQLVEMLTSQEIEAMRMRINDILDNPVLPPLDPYRNTPWPWI